jgi:dynein light chain 4
MAEAVASGEGPAGEAAAEKGPERDFRRLQNYPLIRSSDMNEELRTEAMELCVTAAEKFSNNNEVSVVDPHLKYKVCNTKNTCPN